MARTARASARVFTWRTARDSGVALLAGRGLSRQAHRRSTCAKDATGSSFVEYIVLVGVIALVAMTAAKLFGDSARRKSQQDAACIATLDAGCVGLRPPPDAGAPVAVAIAAADAPRSDDGGPRAWARDFAVGVATGAWDSVKDAGLLIWSALPPVTIYDLAKGRPNRAVDLVAGVSRLAASATPPGRLVAALGGPDPMAEMTAATMRSVSEAWNSQTPARFAGRVVGNVVGTASVVGVAGKLGAAAGIARTATTAAKVEDAAAIVSRDVAQQILDGDGIVVLNTAPSGIETVRLPRGQVMERVRSGSGYLYRGMENGRTVVYGSRGSVLHDFFKDAFGYDP